MWHESRSSIEGTGYNMRRYEHILAITDFSPGARRAVERAAQLAAAHGATLDVLHAAADFPKEWLARMGLAEQWPQQAYARIEEQLKEAASACRAHGIEPRIRMRPGSPTGVIEPWIGESDVDLLVMGARGQGGFKQLLLGSTAERLIEKGLCDTLVVRNGHEHAYRNVLACVALTLDSERIVAAAADLCPEADVQVLHAFQPELEVKLQSYGMDASVVSRHREQAEREARHALAELVASPQLPGHRIASTVRAGHPVPIIVEAVERDGYELVAVGRRTSKLERFLVGSVTKQLLRTTTTDVLVVTR